MKTLLEITEPKPLLAAQLHDRRDEMQSVDLRYKNGFTIAWNVDKSLIQLVPIALRIFSLYFIHLCEKDLYFRDI